jgi:hypothetical protein
MCGGPVSDIQFSNQKPTLFRESCDDMMNFIKDESLVLKIIADIAESRIISLPCLREW